MLRGFHAPSYRIKGLYECTKLLGAGSFGTVYGATHLLTGVQVAVKVEPDTEASVHVVPYEAAVYRVLRGEAGIPRLHWSGEEGGAHIMVIDHVGPTLEHLRYFCRGSLTLKTVLLLGDQMLSRLQMLHSHGLIHRDVKPGNFAMGVGARSNLVYLFDFGFAKLYRASDGQHMPYREGRDGPGTARYASVNYHFGREQSRRDDLEALGYVLLYLYRGRLPWQGIYAADVQAKLRRMGEMKAAILDHLQGCPLEFTEYFKYCRNLGFDEMPDYDYLRGLMQAVMSRNGWEYDFQFDWSQGVKTPTGNILPEQFLGDIEQSYDHTQFTSK